MIHANEAGSRFSCSRETLQESARSLLLAALMIPLFLTAPAQAKQSVHIWIEAEDFETATEGFKKVTGSHAIRSKEEDSGFFSKRSGWDTREHELVSGDAYIEMATGFREHPTLFEEARYQFSVPTTGAYYFWIRCDAPPPCNRHMNLWLDSIEQREHPMFLTFAHWGVWVWWPWGNSHNTGIAKPYQLDAGEHTLYLGEMSRALRIDKILVTDDSHYIPFGLNQQYYTGTFEPPEIKDVRRNDENITDLAPCAFGWEPSPASQWLVAKHPLVDNHYYSVTPVGPGKNRWDPATSLIEDFKCIFFNAEFSLLIPPDSNQEAQDSLFLMNWRNRQHFDGIRFLSSWVAAFQVRGGVISIIDRASFPIPPRSEPYEVSVHRAHADLLVMVDSKEALVTRMTTPLPGSVGIGSHSGDVGFDNIRVTPVNTVDATFDFSDSDDPALQDWSLLRPRPDFLSATSDPIRNGDILLYHTQPWADSAVTIDLPDDRIFSILFPYKSPSHHLETSVNTRPDGSIRAIRHLGLEPEYLQHIETEISEMTTRSLTIQSVKGLFSIFLNGKRIFETNEYDLLSGTIGILVRDDQPVFPITKLHIEHKEMVVDGFTIAEKGELPPHWRVINGTWKVASVLDGDHAQHDGQLTALGSGEALLGDESWRDYILQASVLMDVDSEFSLLCRVQHEGSLELHCRCGSIQIRKIKSGQPIVLAEAIVPELVDGWHKVGFAVNDDQAIVEIDGEEVRRVSVNTSTGRAGFRNYGDFMAVDNLTIHILSRSEPKTPGVQAIDPLIIDIERDILEGM